MKPIKTLPKRIEANLFLTPALKKYCVMVSTKIMLKANKLGLILSLWRKALVARC
jgi:hypothetical protein